MLDFDLNNFQKCLNSKSLKEHQYLRLIKSIHNNFTVGRDQIDLYTQNQDMVSAYTMFYLPTNFPKFHFLMDQLPPDDLQQISNSFFIDFGTGPGTYLLSFLDYFKKSKNDFLGALGIDRSSQMLEQSRSCLRHFYPELEKKIELSDKIILDKKQKITLCFGNCLNEIGVSKALGIVEKVKPDFIIFLSIGTKDSFEKILKFRKESYSHGFSSSYPCFNINNSCPLENTTDWCHQVLKTIHHPTIERLSQKLKMDRRTLPLIAHIYKKEKKAIEREGSARLIRILSETKFSFVLEVCIEESNLLKHLKFELMKKDLSKDVIKKFRKTNLGINIKYVLVKKINENLWRVKLII